MARKRSKRIRLKGFKKARVVAKAYNKKHKLKSMRVIAKAGYGPSVNTRYSKSLTRRLRNVGVLHDEQYVYTIKKRRMKRGK